MWAAIHQTQCLHSDHTFTQKETKGKEVPALKAGHGVTFVSLLKHGKFTIKSFFSIYLNITCALVHYYVSKISAKKYCTFFFT